MVLALEISKVLYFYISKKKERHVFGNGFFYRIEGGISPIWDSNNKIKLKIIIFVVVNSQKLQAGLILSCHMCIEGKK